jgi:hypothetical protein
LGDIFTETSGRPAQNEQKTIVCVQGCPHG